MPGRPHDRGQDVLVHVRPAGEGQAPHRQGPVDRARRLRSVHRRARRLDAVQRSRRQALQGDHRRPRAAGQGRLRRGQGGRSERRPAQLRAAVHRHPRRRARDLPVHRLPAHAGRHRQGLPDHGRHARGGQGRRDRARVRLAAGRVRAPVADAGLGHARQDVARAGPDRGYRGPAHRDGLDDRLLPVPGRHRRPRAAHLRGAVLRRDPVHTGDADPAGHRGSDPHDRRRSRREHRGLRTHQGGGARRQKRARRHLRRATARASRRSSTPTP